MLPAVNNGIQTSKSITNFSILYILWGRDGLAAGFTRERVFIIILKYFEYFLFTKSRCLSGSNGSYADTVCLWGRGVAPFLT